MHDEFLNQRHSTFFFKAILDGIFLCCYGTYEYDKPLMDNKNT
jgi:hypothetical protein